MGIARSDNCWMNENTDEIYLAKITQYVDFASGEINCIRPAVVVAFVVHVETVIVHFNVLYKSTLSRSVQLTWFLLLSSYRRSRIINVVIGSEVDHIVCDLNISLDQTLSSYPSAHCTLRQISKMKTRKIIIFLGCDKKERGQMKMRSTMVMRLMG